MLALKGQVIMREGQPGQEMFFLMRGEVKVEAQREVLGYLSSGETQQANRPQSALLRAEIVLSSVCRLSSLCRRLSRHSCVVRSRESSVSNGDSS